MSIPCGRQGGNCQCTSVEECSWLGQAHRDAISPSDGQTSVEAARRDVVVTDEMLVEAMRAFERMSSVLRYREKDKWHACDMMGMRDAIRAAMRLAR